MNNREAAGIATFLALAAGAAYFVLGNSKIMKGKTEEIPVIFQDEQLGPKVKEIISRHLDKFTSGDSLIKIVRQLDFWYSQGLSEKEILEITDNLTEKASILNSDFQCPKVRFGKTELQMPIVTCGGMRFQQTWLPDFMFPLAPRRSQVLNSPSQENLLNALRLCFKHGITHFETARFYGTSEYQFVEALHTMIKNGEIKREDFIFQTKIPLTATRKDFEKYLKQSWDNCERLGYIDLLAFHLVSTKEQTQLLLAEGEDTCMAAALEYKRQGKIKHLGFSTHGPAKNILEVINSGKLDYVNIHCHFLGSYHAEGTMDGHGGHGNQYAVKWALELDMGVFLISPLDKGGQVYNPSKTLARTLGQKMTPIEFAMLSAWKLIGHHTVSVGFARPADIEDALAAARLFTQKDCDAQLQAAVDRMDAQMEKELGKEWKEKGLLNIPSCEEESTHGTAIGHVLWLYNLMKSFGMYDFCSTRYKNLVGCSWNDKKSFEENRKKMSPGNMGRAYIPGLAYKKALEAHYDPQAAISNMSKLDEWMKIDKDDSKTRGEKGFEAAYDLRAWETYPGEVDVKGIVLQNITFGLLGCQGGPTKSSAEYAARLAEEVKKC